MRVLTIDIKENGLTLKTVLRRYGLTERQISALKFAEEGIRVNGERARVTSVLKMGDVVTLSLREKSQAAHSAITVEILYEDEDLVIVNKPPGVVCHPAHGHLDDDMVTALQAYRSGEYDPVGRLDREASGVMVYGRSSLSAARLNRQLEEGTMKKTYLAVVEGVTEESGVLRYGLEKQDGVMARRIIKTDDDCITRYTRLKTDGVYSLLEVELGTGKTHQIRAGFAAYGHPLAGDTLYGGSTGMICRAALHAVSLSLRQPFTLAEIEVQAPVPQDMLVFGYFR